MVTVLPDHVVFEKTQGLSPGKKKKKKLSKFK